MEQRKHAVMLSGLGLGVGLGIGLLLARGARASTLSTASLMRAQSLELTEIELLKHVMDGKTSAVTFDEFPYYLNEQTRVLLTNAAYVHLKGSRYSKFTRNLVPASKAILLFGSPGTEAYQQMLAKALAHYFEAQLLVLDSTDFVVKVQDRYQPAAGYRGALPAIGGVLANQVAGLASRILAVKDIFQDDGLKASEAVVTEKADLPAEGSEKPANKAVEESSSTAAPVGGASATVQSEKLFVEALFRVLSSLSQKGPVVLYLRDVERLLVKRPRTYAQFVKKLKRLSGPILVLGSRIVPVGQEGSGERKVCLDRKSEVLSEKLSALFTYSIKIKPPEDNVRLLSWKSQLEEDMKAMKAEDNRNHIAEVLLANDVECDDLSSICFSDTVLIGKHIEEVVVVAISHHLMQVEEPEYRSGRLLVSSKSLAYGLSLFQAGQLDTKGAKLQLEGKGGDTSKELQETTPVGKTEGKTDGVTPAAAADAAKSDTPKVDSPKKVESDTSKPASTPKPASSSASPTVSASKKSKDAVPPDNEFEKRIRPEVIPAGEVGVSFDDIGALEGVKDSLQELVMLPLRRPELFNRGGLVKRCKGILLFGPPGTGKTMLAKAVATEAGASFINVSMSAITSKWFGEDEKNVRALFTLAAKVAPTVIFVDEVDSMLGQRSRVGEHEAMRKIKNEFMAHWDGLLTRGSDRVLVLAATNRPFDLDEAIIRRFERRIMVGLPDTENREKILKAILAKEDLAEDFDFKELAVMTEGYSGSDLKNLCVAAAYRPMREFLKKEQQEEAKRKAAAKEAAAEAAAEAAKAAEAAVAVAAAKALADAGASAVESIAPAAEEVAVQEVSKTATTDTEGKEPENQGSAGIKPPVNLDVSSCSVLSLRALTVEDFRQAKNQVSASFASEGCGMQELREWNELYGEGGSRKKQQLSYFL